MIWFLFHVILCSTQQNSAVDFCLSGYSDRIWKMTVTRSFTHISPTAHLWCQIFWKLQLCIIHILACTFHTICRRMKISRLIGALAQNCDDTVQNTSYFEVSFDNMIWSMVNCLDIFESPDFLRFQRALICYLLRSLDQFFLLCFSIESFQKTWEIAHQFYFGCYRLLLCWPICYERISVMPNWRVCYYQL